MNFEDEKYRNWTISHGVHNLVHIDYMEMIKDIFTKVNELEARLDEALGRKIDEKE